MERELPFLDLGLTFESLNLGMGKEFPGIPAGRP